MPTFRKHNDELRNMSIQQRDMMNNGYASNSLDDNVNGNDNDNNNNGNNNNDLLWNNKIINQQNWNELDALYDMDT